MDSIYIIIEAENLWSQLAPMEMFKKWESLDYTLLATLVFLPTMLLPNLSILSYFSACGVAAAFILILGVVWDGLAE